MLAKITRRARIVVALTLACIAGCRGDGPTGPSGTSIADTPAGATLVATDIENFWRAFDAGGSSGSVTPFQQEYLDRASPGLRDFIVARNITAASLVQMVRAYPRYFASIRPTTLRLGRDAALTSRIRANFERIESLYPAAVFPPVTFLIGRFSTGGTVRESGILIGAEFYTAGASTPLDELGAFQRDNVKPLDSIPPIIAHEHAHVLQGRAGGLWAKQSKTLLEQSLGEGGADFVGELASGGNFNAQIYAYGYAHEQELWDEFRAVMNGTDVSRWLYNQGTASGGRPGDLGYFIGYRIAQSYYNRVTDKRAALRGVIEITDAQAFLTASGYNGGR